MLSIGNHAILVNHLVADDDVPGPLLDVGAVAVDSRQNRADHPPSDAAIVVAVKFRGLVLPEETQAVLSLAALPLGRQRRKASVRRIDDERRRVRQRRAALEPVPRRVVGGLVFLELRLRTLAVVLGHLFRIRLVAARELFIGQRRAGAELLRTLEGHANRVVARVRAADVGIAPRRPRRRVASLLRRLRQDRRRDDESQSQRAQSFELHPPSTSLSTFHLSFQLIASRARSSLRRGR